MSNETNTASAQPTWKNVEVVELIVHRSGKLHKGYWNPIAGFANGGRYEVLCGGTVHCISPMRTESKPKTVCKKCFPNGR